MVINTVIFESYKCGTTEALRIRRVQDCHPIDAFHVYTVLGAIRPNNIFVYSIQLISIQFNFFIPDLTGHIHAVFMTI